ncbi:MAG: signal peptidase I [Lachnospiraceae bacterium]|nr:signal peptidase I [Lachnospiraceae bacterium]
MYDEKSIEDSLEFVRQIKLYKENDPEKILDSLRNNVDKHNSVYEDYQSEAAKVINNIDSLKEKEKSSIIGDLKDIPSWDSFAVTKEEKEEAENKADVKAESVIDAKNNSDAKEVNTSEEAKKADAKAEGISEDAKKADEKAEGISEEAKKADAKAEGISEEAKKADEKAEGISKDAKKADAKAENTSEEIVEVDEPDEDEDEEESSRFSFGDFMYIVGCVVVAIALAFVVTHYVGHHTRVDGSSMNNTLKNGDYLVIEKVSYYLHDPERYDIIVFPFTDEVNYIKRIIGLPGETVQIKDGKVFINGNELSDDVYGNELINDPGLAANPVSLGANEYFVLGDNRNSSIDSRKPVVGNIDGKKIDGKAVFRIYPFAAFGGVE